MYDLIIIGGGPAALSAAFYAQTKNINTIMPYEELGGKVGWHQEESPDLPGNELVNRLIMRTSEQPSRMINDRALAIARGSSFFRVETQRHDTLEAAALIIATGATPRLLDLPGAQRFITQGLGYSIKTFAHLVTGKQVAVIGSTLRALRGTAELARTSEQVYLIVPGSSCLENNLASSTMPFVLL